MHRRVTILSIRRKEPFHRPVLFNRGTWYGWKGWWCSLPRTTIYCAIVDWRWLEMLRGVHVDLHNLSVTKYWRKGLAWPETGHWNVALEVWYYRCVWTWLQWQQLHILCHMWGCQVLHTTKTVVAEYKHAFPEVLNDRYVITLHSAPHLKCKCWSVGTATKY